MSVNTLFAILLVFSVPITANSRCLLIDNIIGYTPTTYSPELSTFNWLAFSKGKVIATGSKQQNKPNCKHINGKGRVLLPGLIDAHGHVVYLGKDLLQINLRNVSSEYKISQLIKVFFDGNKETNWIKGSGWNQTLWTNKQFPHKRSLDKLGINKPIFLERVDGHAAWVNSAALALAGINRNTPDPAGGIIMKDGDGEPSGILIDNAMNLVAQHIPQSSNDQLDLEYDKAYQQLLSQGIVSVHDAGIDQADLDHYERLQQHNKLPLRIYGMLDAGSPQLAEWLSNGAITDDNDFLSVRSVKIISDGALGSRGAALIKPYSDQAHNSGLIVTDAKRLNALTQQILAKGFQVNIHAIGDRANRLSLNALELAYVNTDGIKQRNRIEHAQIIHPQDIPRFKTLNLIASMQPTHATSDMNMAGDRLGEQRLAGAYAWQTLLQQGTIIASGSDFPVELANPFHGLHAAVTRSDHQNQPIDGWLPQQKMTLTQALRSFTLDAAYAAHQEKTLGSLEPGKWADFIFVDQDIVQGKPQDIWKTTVLETWIAGELKYQK